MAFGPCPRTHTVPSDEAFKGIAASGSGFALDHLATMRSAVRSGHVTLLAADSLGAVEQALNNPEAAASHPHPTHGLAMFASITLP